jgi:hypothetical protein
MTDNEKPAFAAAFGGLCLALREKEPDAPQLRIYFEALKDLDVELVTAAAEHLVKHGAGDRAWFPKAPEWRTVVETIERQRYDEQKARIRERLRAGLPPLCLACNDTGFARDEAKNRVTPCDCRKLRRLEVLGRRPMPALPAGPESA